MQIIPVSLNYVFIAVELLRYNFGCTLNIPRGRVYPYTDYIWLRRASKKGLVKRVPVYVAAADCSQEPLSAVKHSSAITANRISHVLLSSGRDSGALRERALELKLSSGSRVSADLCSE